VAAALAWAAGLVLVRRRRLGRGRGVPLEGVVREPASRLSPVVVVVNPGGGSAGDLDLDDAGVRVRRLGDGEDLEDVVRGLARDGVAVLGMAGGDGSVGCAAGAAADGDRVLWAVPGGTLNHFARAVGLPTPEDAVRALRAGAVARVDLGDAGGTAFVNNASLGIYGDLVRRRERLEARGLPKRLALLVAAARALRHADPMELEIDGRPRRAYLVFVGNGPYAGAGLTGRESLQRGLLDVRVLPAERRLPRLSVLGRIVLARRGESRWLRPELRPEVSVTLHEPARLAHDGEAREDVRGEIRFRSRPGALRVIVPPPDGAAGR
jgi:undecaprenyl-diphosphatase